MNKNLEVIQKISRVARIVCRVLVVVSIVACALSLVSVIFVAVFGTGELLKIDDITIYGIVVTDSMSKGQVISMLISSAIMMVPAIILMKFAENYFAQELKDGTPFTITGADKIMRLGIMTIVMPIIAEFISQLLISINMDTKNINMTTGGAVTTGLTLIFLHFVFKYGAEVTASDRSEAPAAAVQVPESKDE